MEKYCSDLLNNDNGSPTSSLPSLAEQDLPICVDPPTLEEEQTAIPCHGEQQGSRNEQCSYCGSFQGGGDVMANTMHAFCVEVFNNKHTAPDHGPPM